MPNISPRILLTDTNRWDLSARLAIGLSRAGGDVFAVCPGYGHALHKTHAVKGTFCYSPRRPLSSLQDAIESVAPDLIVPSCDRSVEHLHDLYDRSQRAGNAGRTISELISRSLGNPTSFPVVSSRFRLMESARAEGIRTPDFAQLSSIENLHGWCERQPFPFVLKVDGSWGGRGVRVVRSPQQLHEAWDYLTRMGRLARRMKRWVINRDAYPLWSWQAANRRPITAQSWVEGRPANCSAFAWGGRVLALIGVDVICSDGATGPARLVRLVENPEMRFAAEKIASSHGISGFFGLDFMIEERTGVAILVEMNPRLAPPGYLRLGPGKDLIGSLFESLSGTPLLESVRETSCDTVCYQRVHKGAGSDSGETYYPVVPFEESELIHELQNPYPDRTVLFRLLQCLSRKRVADEVFTVPLGVTSGSLSECPLVSESRGGKMTTSIEKVRVRTALLHKDTIPND